MITKTRYTVTSNFFLDKKNYGQYIRSYTSKRQACISMLAMKKITIENNKFHGHESACIGSLKKGKIIIRDKKTGLTCFIQLKRIIK